LERPRSFHGIIMRDLAHKTAVGQQFSYGAQLLPRKALTGKVTSERASTVTASLAVASSFVWY
jgi:hypothetical protein